MALSSAFNLFGQRIFVAGHRGMVGSAVVRRLAWEGCDILTAGRETLDLKRQSDVEAYMRQHRPDIVIMAAARVGGILANDTYPADFLYDNVIMEANIFQAAHEAGVDRFLFLGSSCVYPKFAEQPIQEESLLTGPLEPTNEWYAVAKITGIKLAQAFRRQHGRNYISAMPCNLYGPGDNFDLVSSHVLPAIIRKVHAAKVKGHREIVVWGTGSPLREFLHCDDCADALVFLLKSYSDETHINVGSGSEISVLDLTRMVCDVVGYDGHIAHDLTKPDGTPRKLMSSARLQELGWSPRLGLREGIAQTYEWFLNNVSVSAS